MWKPPVVVIITSSHPMNQPHLTIKDGASSTLTFDYGERKCWVGGKS
jgi:hypothetical protein